jgi:hypothetical protein
MLHILPTQGDDKTGELGVVATDALWLDLLNPTSAEVTNVEKTVGATLPSLGRSARLRRPAPAHDRRHDGASIQGEGAEGLRPARQNVRGLLGRLSADRLARQGCSRLVGHDHRAAELGLDRRTQAMERARPAGQELRLRVGRQRLPAGASGGRGASVSRTNCRERLDRKTRSAGRALPTASVRPAPLVFANDRDPGANRPFSAEGRPGSPSPQQGAGAIPAPQPPAAVASGPIRLSHLSSISLPHPDFPGPCLGDSR